MRHSPSGGWKAGKSLGRIQAWVPGATRPDVRSAQKGHSLVSSRRRMRAGTWAVYWARNGFQTRRDTTRAASCWGGGPSVRADVSGDVSLVWTLSALGILEVLEVLWAMWSPRQPAA